MRAEKIHLGARIPAEPAGFGPSMRRLRDAHRVRASASMDYEIVKLFRNPVPSGNCFHEFLLRQAATQGATSPADRLEFLNQAGEALDADAYRLRFQAAWRALTSTGCAADGRTAMWRRYLASRNVDSSNAQSVMEYVEKTAAGYDGLYRAERKSLGGGATGNSIAFRSRSGLFVTSIFDTAFRLDSLIAWIRGQDPALRWKRVLVVGPGLNIVDQFLGTQVPVSSPQPVCLLESLLAHRLGDGSTRIDLADLSPEVVRHWNEAARRSSGYRLLGYLGSDAPAREYLETFGARIRTAEREWFASQPHAGEILFGGHAGRFRAIGPGDSELAVRDLVARPAALRRFSATEADVVTDRIAENETYDAIVATNLLLYFEPAEASLAVFNMSRMLVRGGYLLVTENLDALLPPGHPLRQVRSGLTYVYRKQ